ncbi:CRISPR-associated protein Cas4 [Lacrimispora sp. 210928-DFI.3.58]|uniref:CRISPR-associated protein Cas4 n=1 Tax=Lacrimispora sp. 210928-DFI.3.58 TaxID=2883214 RepID=UPI0015B4567F|nr:CRISPR-associated protein Cas4 [Lacrimispora sp. 210928-DFI.3.58]MCB7317459.1 CRISPR-associated protein Cas4 [Lacrimispora sp. 210928-DFI.3.58]
MEYREEEYLMLSGIQHYAFCKRQWALIHLEQQWQENVHTVSGELLHRKAHDKFSFEKRNDVLITRGLPVHSRELGISGECDVVEFCCVEDGITIFGHKGNYRPFPIEYKKGKPKTSEIDILQLAAQALCLEEMFSIDVPSGAVYYGEIRKRENIEITAELREQVRKMLTEMHELFQRGYTPRVKWSKACNACSLKDICLPKLGKAGSVSHYIDTHIREETL